MTKPRRTLTDEELERCFAFFHRCEEAWHAANEDALSVRLPTVDDDVESYALALWTESLAEELGMAFLLVDDRPAANDA